MQRIFILVLLIGSFSACDTFEKRREQALSEKKEDSLRQVVKEDSLKREKKVAPPTYKLTDTSSVSAKKTEPSPTTVNQDLKTGKLFYVIAGSFAKREEADKLLQSLKSDKFDKAEIINDDKGGFRVAVQSFNNKDDAKKLSESLKTKYTNISSWVLAK